MKKVLFFITLMPYLFFSQGHRFIYELKYKPDSTAEKAERVEMVLDIGKKEVKFYDLEFLKVDSLSKKTGENWQTNSQTQQLLKRNLGEDKSLNYKDVMFDYYVIESDDKNEIDRTGNENAGWTSSAESHDRIRGTEVDGMVQHRFSY